MTAPTHGSFAGIVAKRARDACKRGRHRKRPAAQRADLLDRRHGEMRQSFTMATSLFKRRTFACLLLAPSLCGLAVGCGDSAEKFYPVAGKVLLDGNPLTTVAQGSVSFHGDAAKGNSTMHQPIGTINAAGEYELVTVGRKGAPPGWYKVVVAAYANKIEEGPVTPRLLIAQKYYNADTTDLSIEVVAGPPVGAYDLKVTK